MDSTTPETNAQVLSTLPPEVLEHIVYHLALLGGLSSVLSLLLTSRALHAALSPSDNPHPYARIYAALFDTAASERRLPPSAALARTRTTELRRRTLVLRTIARSELALTARGRTILYETVWTRSEHDAFDRRVLRPSAYVEDPGPEPEAEVDLENGHAFTPSFNKAREPHPDAARRELLWTCYLMMLENDGKNERALRKAGLVSWLRSFWLDPNGASECVPRIGVGIWPKDEECQRLAMWLFWFLLRPEEKQEQEDKLISLLKMFALGAHKYQISGPNWTQYHPTPSSSYPSHPSSVTHLSHPLMLTTPPISIPATLAYLALANKRPVHNPDAPVLALIHPLAIGMDRPPPTAPAAEKGGLDSVEWEQEWRRCLSVARGSERPGRGVGETGVWRPGSAEGVWEGVFVYTEFPAFAALLAGAGPDVLSRSSVGQHRQTWKLREYNLIRPARTTSASEGGEKGPDEDEEEVIDLARALANGVHITDTDTGTDGESEPVPDGSALRAFISPAVTVEEQPGFRWIECKAGLGKDEVRYRRAGSVLGADEEVADVIVCGEGHSAWGQFNLLGRVRPLDGLLTLSKTYLDGARGEWVYRGYLVGDLCGNVAGRWRDNLTPVNEQGYEGCFAMSRRR